MLHSGFSAPEGSDTGLEIGIEANGEGRRSAKLTILTSLYLFANTLSALPRLRYNYQILQQSFFAQSIYPGSPSPLFHRNLLKLQRNTHLHLPPE